MPKSLINEAVPAQVINHLRNGQFKRCAEMGLKLEILAQLQQPFAMSFLTNAPVSWVEVRANIDVMEKILATAECPQQEGLQIKRALKLGATTTMIQSFFGLLPEDTATKRLIMAIHPRRGRQCQLDGTLEHQTWYCQEHLMRENQISSDDSLALLDIAMISTEEINAGTDRDSLEFISPAVVRSLTQSRLRDGLYSSDKLSQAQAGQPRFPTTLYLAGVSSHLSQSASQVDAKIERR